MRNIDTFEKVVYLGEQHVAVFKCAFPMTRYNYKGKIEILHDYKMDLNSLSIRKENILKYKTANWEYNLLETEKAIQTINLLKGEKHDN